MEWAVSRTKGRAAAEPAAIAQRLLRFPHYARGRPLHDRRGFVRGVAALARQTVRDALVSQDRRADLVGRLCRRDRRLGGERERPPAVDRRRHIAHRGCGVAGTGRKRGDDARSVRRRLSHSLFVRRLFHQPADRARHPGDKTSGTGSASRRRSSDIRERAMMGDLAGNVNVATVLPLIWATLIGIAVAFYVVLDGFDLGIGILFPFAKDDAERDRMLASIAPYWDGNETWLVLGGGGLLVAFPRAYSIIMPAFYLPLIVMLLALVFRGVTFEFRAIAQRKPFWNAVFAGGSTLAALCQGLVLGGLVQGIKVQNGAFAGGPLDWATPFGLMCAFGVVAGYALLGATWLMMKTDGALKERAAWQAKELLAAVLVFMAAVSLYTPLAIPRIAQRWFTLPNLIYLSPVPILTL